MRALLPVPPHLINVGGPWHSCLSIFPGRPRAHPEETDHVHFVYIVHSPPGFEQLIVCFVDIIRQRQGFFFLILVERFIIRSASSATGIVGNSSKAAVVCVWTAIRARAMSCESRSAG